MTLRELMSDEYIITNKYIHKYEGKIRWVSYIFKKRFSDEYIFFSTLGYPVFGAYLKTKNEFNIIRQNIHFTSKNKSFKCFTLFNRFVERNKRIKELTNKLVLPKIFLEQPSLFINHRWGKGDEGVCNNLIDKTQFQYYELEIYLLFKYLGRLINQNPTEFYKIPLSSLQNIIHQIDNENLTNNYLDIYFQIANNKNIEFWQDDEESYYINFVWDKNEEKLLMIFESQKNK